MNRQTILFLLPIFALLLIGGTYSYKWWKSRTSMGPTQAPLSEGVKLEEEGQSLIKNFGLSEKNTTQLKPVNSFTGTGVVNVGEEGKDLTVVASLPELSGEHASSVYQVWMEAQEGDKQLLGTLRQLKGGYILDYSSQAVLPTTFSLSVSREKQSDAKIEEIVLQGNVAWETEK